MNQGAKRIIRVFPRKTSATPDDELVAINRPPELFDEADEVHISCAFSWDKPSAERLAYMWEPVAPVKVGGPAYGYSADPFVPGMYVKHGYAITSRGCPNGCWFCCDRKQPIVEMNPVPLGYNHLTSNMLACSDQHIDRVFASCIEAKRVFRRPILFTGGLEAARLKPWHVDRLREVRPQRMYFAYDTPNDLDPLRQAGTMLRDAGWNPRAHTLCCYVLVGWPASPSRCADEFANAEKRIDEVIAAGFVPMAMAYRGEDGRRGDGWAAWQRLRANATIICGEFNRRWPKQ